MTSPREIELKLEVPVQAVARLTRSPLLQKPQNGPQRPLISVYYDTEKRKLRKHGLTLRVRHIGRRYVQTVKLENAARSALLDRGEWEHDIEGGKPQLKLAREAGFKSIFNKKVQAKLKPLFETRVRRKVYPISSGDSEIELTLDKGTVIAGRRSAPICEVELELKRGSPAELFKVARGLAEQIPVQLAVTTKPDRGFALIDGEKPVVTRADRVAIPPGADCRTAFQAIARSCLHQVLANQDATRRGDPNGLHQCRVGLRRLRAAIVLFGEMLRDPQTDTIKGELKWIAQELGPARELDVFFNRVVKPATTGKSKQPGVATLMRQLRRKRHEAYGRALTALNSERLPALALETAAWIESGSWTRNPDEFIRAIRQQPVEIVAAAELERRRNKIRKRGKNLSQLNSLQRHRIRIQAKKLRYAAEFFETVFPGKKPARRQAEFIGALEQLQDTLGDLHDIAVHEGLTERLADVADAGHPPRNRAVGKAFAAGRLSGREEARIAASIKDAERAYARFAKAKPFWR